jgi:hypothetical protein
MIWMSSIPCATLVQNSANWHVLPPHRKHRARQLFYFCLLVCLFLPICLMYYYSLQIKMGFKTKNKKNWRVNMLTEPLLNNVSEHISWNFKWTVPSWRRDNRAFYLQNTPRPPPSVSFPIGSSVKVFLPNATRSRLWRVPMNRKWLTMQTGSIFLQTKTKLHGLSPRANYTDRATAASRRSNCQLLRIEGATWSAWRIPTAVFSAF